MRILLPRPKITLYFKVSALNTKFLALCMISKLREKKHFLTPAEIMGLLIWMWGTVSEKKTHLLIFQKSQKVDREKFPPKLQVSEFPTNRNLCIAFCVGCKDLNGQNHSLSDSLP